jgi:hypothetical protein
MTQDQTTGTKYANRERAIELLTKQLEKGMKPISKGKKPFRHKKYGNPVWSYDQTAIEHTEDSQGYLRPVRLQELPLTAEDRRRINIQITNLKAKQNRQMDHSHMKALEEKVLIGPKRGVIKSGDSMRPKNPKTKLYEFIAGVYKKITK